MAKKNEDFIARVYKGKGISDSYPVTMAHFSKKKQKAKVEAEVGDVVLLVTKKGHENVKGHVGTVTAVREKDYSFETMSNGKKTELKLPYNFLAKSGMVTVGFYTVK